MCHLEPLDFCDISATVLHGFIGLVYVWKALKRHFFAFSCVAFCGIWHFVSFKLTLYSSFLTKLIKWIYLETILVIDFSPYTTWHGMALLNRTWSYMTWHGMTWHDMLWRDMTWHGMTWHGNLRDSVFASSPILTLILIDMRWQNMAGHGMIWHVLIWHVMSGCYVTSWDKLCF